MRPRPDRLERLPPQYFAALLAAGRRGREAGRAARCSTSGAATPRSGRRRTSSRRCARRRRGRTCTATRRSAGCRGCARRSPRATATSTAPTSTPSARSRSCPGTKTAIIELCARARRSAATRSCCPTRLPRLPVGRRARGRRARRCCRSTRRPAGRPTSTRRRPRRPRSSTTRRTRARSARRPGMFEAAVAYAERTGDGDRRRRRVHRPRLRRPRARELPRDAGREGRRRRDVDDVEDVRHGRLADRLRRRQRRDRRAREPAGRPLARRHVRAAAGGGDRRARPARRTRSRSGARPTSGAATGSSAALPEPPVCEGSFYVWLRLPEGLTADRLLAEQRVAIAPGEGFGPSGAGWARLSLAVADDVLDEGSSASRPRSPRRTHEDRDRRSVLVVVLGRRRRARREPGRRAARTRARGEDRDGQRPARAADALLHPRTGRHGGLPPDIIPVGRSVVVPANGSLPNIVLTPRLDPPHPRRAARGALRRRPRARADDAGDLRRGARARALPARRHLARGGRPRLDEARRAVLGLPDGADRRADRRLADGGGVGRALARRRVRDRPERRRHPRARRRRGREHRIVFIGRHDARKGLPVLLRAWPEIRRRTGARLRLIGTDPLQYRFLHSRMRFDEDGIDVLGIVTNEVRIDRARLREAVRLARARRRELRARAGRGVRDRDARRRLEHPRLRRRRDARDRGARPARRRGRAHRGDRRRCSPTRSAASRWAAPPARSPWSATRGTTWRGGSRSCTSRPPHEGRDPKPRGAAGPGRPARRSRSTMIWWRGPDWHLVRDVFTDRQLAVGRRRDRAEPALDRRARARRGTP